MSRAMPTQRSTIDDLRDATLGAGEVTFRPMFGEWAVYHEGKIVGLVCDDALFLKVTPPGRALLDETHDAPPYPGAKPYLKVPPDRAGDADWISNLVRVTADALPTPAPKKAKKPATKANPSS